MPPSDTPGAAGTCSDCPPVGYPTDATRCLPCPRRGAPQNVLTPGAAEIEAAALVTAQQVLNYFSGYAEEETEGFEKAALVLAMAYIHLHAQVATLTARAEAAEARLTTALDDKDYWGARVAELEAAMSNREAAEQLMRHFFSPGDPQWSSKLGTLTAVLDAAERRGLERAAEATQGVLSLLNHSLQRTTAEVILSAIRALAKP